MDQPLPKRRPIEPFVVQQSLARRVARRLILLVALPVLGYGFIIALWILMAPRV
jgi:hypothetical protein